MKNLPAIRLRLRWPAAICAALVFGAFAAAAAVGAQGVAPGQSEADYLAAIEQWRQEREERLRADDGWLTVAGLHWPVAGPNSVGSDPLSDIVLPAGAPARVGTLEYDGSGAGRFRAEAGVAVTYKDRQITSTSIRAGPAEALQVGAVSFWLHRSGERHGIRVRDLDSALRREFTGCRWFPVDPGFRLLGQFIPYDRPLTVRVPNILGDIEIFTSPGEVAFTFAGEEIRMEAVSSGADRLWFIFRDLTGGAETYPAARFLYTDAPSADGTVVMDFNQAQNPPCAFNPYTTCPLPPQQNRLRVRLEAGELTYVPAS